MSDKKDKSGANLEANLAKIANAKPRRRNRKNNIYERFITRVETAENSETLIEENIDTSPVDIDTGANISTVSTRLVDSVPDKIPLKPLKNADKLSSYEPLSAAELDLFAIQEPDTLENTVRLQEPDDSMTSVSLDFSDDEDNGILNFPVSETIDDVAYQDENVDINDSEEDTNHTSSVAAPLTPVAIKKPKKKKVSKSTAKQASNKKPLILGMVLGSLMIAGAVLTLIATGVLSTEPNTISTPVVENVTKTSPPNKPAASGTEQNVIVDANTTPAVAGELNTATTKPLTPKPQLQEAKATGDEAVVSTPESEPAITYEDFREESQSTLYRETND